MRLTIIFICTATVVTYIVFLLFILFAVLWIFCQHDIEEAVSENISVNENMEPKEQNPNKVYQ